MAKPDPDWTLYRSFLAVLRQGSLSAAARRLGLTQPTVGRHVDLLEQMLDVALFTRSPHGLLPTEAAMALKPHAETMENAAEALLRAASGGSDEEAGTIRLTASEVVGTQVLPAILSRFRRNHPRIEIELVLSNLPQDLLRRESDIAVRHFRPTQSGLVARLIGTVTIGLYAHRDYAARHPLPTSLEEALGRDLIGWDRDPDLDRRTAFIPGLARERFAIRTDSQVAQLALLRAGFGIGACQAPLARPDPDLIPVLPDKIALPMEFWLAMHEGLKSNRLVRLLFDHLAEELGDYLRG